MTSKSLPAGAGLLLLGLLVALAGSFTDDVLGSGTAVTVLQVALWALGGAMMLAGAASVAMLRVAHRDRVEPQRATRRDGGGLRPSVR